MANLKDIRDRISSVKNTRKITEAMRLVAAAKVRRAQEQVLRSRPFADRLARILENLQTRMQFETADAPLLENRDVRTITLMAVTGDRGLCVATTPTSSSAPSSAWLSSRARATRWTWC